MRSPSQKDILPVLPLLLGTVLLLAASPADAATGTSTVSPLITVLGQDITGWYSKILTAGEEIFYVLFGIDFVYLVAQWLIGGKDVHEIFTSFIKKIMTIGVFYTLLLNSQNLLKWVYQGFEKTGVSAGGTTNISVATIFNTMVKIWTALLQGPAAPAAHGSGIVNNVEHFVNTVVHVASAPLSAMLGVMLSGITAFIVLLVMIYVAVEFFSVQIEALLVGSVGAIMLGFTGSRWTAQHAEGFFKFSISVGVRLLVLTLWTGFITQQLSSNITTILNIVSQNGTNTVGLFEGYGEVLVFFLLIAWLTKKLPSIASSVLSGASSLSGSEALEGAAKAAAMAGAMVATGGAAAAGMAGAGTGALSAAEAAAGGAGEAGTLGASSAGAGGEAGSMDAGGEAGSMGAANGANDAAGSNVESVPAPESEQTAKDDKKENNIIPAPLKSVQASSTKEAQPGADKRLTSAVQGAETTTATSTAPGDGDGTPVQSGGDNPAETASTADVDAKPAGDSADHRPDAPNTPTQPVSGVSEVVPAPLPQGAGNTQGTDAGSADASAKAPESASVAGKDASIGNAQLPDGVVREQRIPDAAMRDSGTSGDAGADKVVAAPAGGSGGTTASPDTANGDNVNGGKPASDVDHRPTAPNTPTQPVSGGSDDVPAPEPQKGLMDHAHDLMKNADTIEKGIGHVMNVVSPGQAEKVNVSAGSIGLKHSE